MAPLLLSWEYIPVFLITVCICKPVLVCALAATLLTVVFEYSRGDLFKSVSFGSNGRNLVEQ